MAKTSSVNTTNIVALEICRPLGWGEKFNVFCLSMMLLSGTDFVDAVLPLSSLNSETVLIYGSCIGEDLQLCTRIQPSICRQVTPPQIVKCENTVSTGATR